MRRIYRNVLPIETRLALHHRHIKSTDATLARELWTKYRRSKASTPVVDCLRAMAGPRDRCFYCSDSRAVDIEHFQPLAKAPSKAFIWSNMLWVCAACNRNKGNKPVGNTDDPRLLDPTKVEPWHHFVFDSSTGMIAPRFVGDATDPLATSTLDILTLLNDEPVAEGRLRGSKRLRRAANELLADPSELPFVLLAFKEDDYGLRRWYTHFEGTSEQPFDELRMTYPRQWRRLVKTAAA